MSEHTRKYIPRPELKDRILSTAMEAFKRHGIKSITMDDIALSLGISKRTLYEVFPDKETLLREGILRSKEESEAYARQVLQQTDNVLEVILKLFERSIEQFHTTDKRFIEDLNKYPQVQQLCRERLQRDSEEAIRFMQQGVEQGIFRSDINFGIVDRLLREQFNSLQSNDLCRHYSLIEVYESIMFTYLRGISTPRGAEELERFITQYRSMHASH